jgi:hypothetical protein
LLATKSTPPSTPKNLECSLPSYALPIKEVALPKLSFFVDFPLVAL